MGSWADLCHDILELIMDKFLAIEDIVRFGAVCRPWRSVSVEKWQQFSNSMVYPWLMLAEKEDSDSRGFYSLSTKKVYHMNLPQARGRRCLASEGWLITFGLDLEIHLLNPFSRVQIQLPPQSTFPLEYRPDLEVPPERLRLMFIQKMVLSSKPCLSPCEDEDEDDDDERCVVMVLCSEFKKLAFLRLGDEVWTTIDCGVGFKDIIYFNGQFYALNNEGGLFICDISSPQPKTIELSDEPEVVYQYCNHFLVESLGELFMLAVDTISVEDYPKSEHMYNSRIVLRDQSRTIGFDVYKFNFDNKKWMEVKSLDNRAFFVGNNNSFAVFPSNQHPGCEPNCIYFTDSYLENIAYGDGAGKDMGVFRMETQEIESYYDGPDWYSHFCVPLWISPSL